MPYPAKYTPEQRKKAVELYWLDREEDCARREGRYTLAQIEQLTGVKWYYVSKIARGLR